MDAKEITKGSTLLATLNDENFPFGMAEDLKKELHQMINKALNVIPITKCDCDNGYIECKESTYGKNICTKCWGKGYLDFNNAQTKIM